MARRRYVGEDHGPPRFDGGKKNMPKAAEEKDRRIGAGGRRVVRRREIRRGGGTLQAKRPPYVCIAAQDKVGATEKGPCLCELGNQTLFERYIPGATASLPHTYNSITPRNDTGGYGRFMRSEANDLKGANDIIAGEGGCAYPPASFVRNVRIVKSCTTTSTAIARSSRSSHSAETRAGTTIAMICDARSGHLATVSAVVRDGKSANNTISFTDAT